MSTYYCAECAHETEDRHCPMCGEKTEALEVKDDPLMGRNPSMYSFVGDHEELL